MWVNVITIHDRVCEIFSFLFSLLIVPLELPILRRETFNRWYSFFSYFVALTLVEIPVIFLTNFMYISIVYFMTGQPNEMFRFCFYTRIMFMLAFASQGLGLIAGSVANVKFTLIVGSFLMFPFYMFSNFFILAKDSHPFWHWLFDCSFISHALEGSIQAIFGFERAKMECNAKACLTNKPASFINSLGFVEHSETYYMIKFLMFIITFRLIAFILMSVKLKLRWNAAIYMYILTNKTKFL